MHVIRLFISILTDFVTSHKIAFYSKLYDIDFLENCTQNIYHTICARIFNTFAPTSSSVLRFQPVSAD